MCHNRQKAISQMPRAPKEYRRLPGRGTLLDGDKWYATSRALCTVWMGSDHLLLVSRAGYTENYKRFYFRDIQAIIIRKTVTSLIGNTVLIILAIGFILWAAAVSDTTGKFVLAFLGGFLHFSDAARACGAGQRVSRKLKRPCKPNDWPPGTGCGRRAKGWR